MEAHHRKLIIVVKDATAYAFVIIKYCVIVIVTKFTLQSLTGTTINRWSGYV